MRSVYVIIAVKNHDKFVVLGQYNELKLVEDVTPAHFITVEMGHELLAKLDRDNNPTDKGFLGEYFPEGFELRYYEIVGI